MDASGQAGERLPQAKPKQAGEAYWQSGRLPNPSREGN
jgi:hypothetical protein